MTRGPFRSLLSEPRASKGPASDEATGEHLRSSSPHSHGASAHSSSAHGASIDIRESGIVPARSRVLRPSLPRALSLRPTRPEVSSFGSAVAGGGDMLLVGGRSSLVRTRARFEGETQPFATLYRVTSDRVVRERVLRGAQGHDGPSLATDGTRVAVGQPAAEGGQGFVSVYRRRAADLELEATLELKPDDPASARFGHAVAIHGDLLVLGQPASVCVYRHSAVGWLSAGTLQPPLPYEWNPQFGLSFQALSGRVLVGNPIEINGHRAGPGRVFVYRQDGDQMELEAELLGDGIEAGRDSEPKLGFGAHIHVAGEFVLISAPHELSPSGTPRARVYVYRMQRGVLNRVAALDVPSCQSICMIGERLLVLGDELYVFSRRGTTFEALATYAVNGASAAQVTMARCGALLVLGFPYSHDQGDAGEISLHFPEQF